MAYDDYERDRGRGRDREDPRDRDRDHQRWGRGAGNYGTAGNYDGGNYGDYRGGAAGTYGERARRPRPGGRDEMSGYGPGGSWSSDRSGRNTPDYEAGEYGAWEDGFEGGAGLPGYGNMPPGEGYDRFTGGGIGGPGSEWGAGYGGGYGRSEGYGERGGRNAWGWGQQSGRGARGSTPSDGSSDYGGYGYSSGYRDMNRGQSSSYDASFATRGGERGAFAGRGPRNYRRSDERIREDVNEELTRHPRIDASDIEVSVENGIVTLAGTVDSRQTKRLAEDAIERVTGIQDIENHLRVNRGGSQRVAGDREVNRDTVREGGSVGRETNTRAKTGSGATAGRRGDKSSGPRGG